MPKSLRSIAPALMLLAVGVPDCDTNLSGDLTATRFGDLSAAPPLERSPAGAPLLAACNLAAELGPPPAGLRREPYLQRMTATSVDVAWTADRRAAPPARVVVERPDGVPVTSGVARLETDAPAAAPISLWVASIAGLAPETTYCYAVIAGDAVLRRGGFRTAPAAGSGRAVTFVAFGDSGDGGADQRAVLAQIGAVPFDLMIHLGDIAYGSGTPLELERYFFGVYAGLLRLIPAFPASGNHEYETADAAPFRAAFVLPDNGGPGGRERWYSYDWGDVHFVALDSELVGPEQAAWLDADLAANRLPWTVVYLHRPPFSSGDHGSHAGIQRHFVPLFVKHAVPLVLAGHDHHYERTLVDRGVTYVVSGGGGRGTRPVGHSPFTAFAESVCHFVHVTVEQDHLTLRAIDGVGQHFDSLVIRR